MIQANLWLNSKKWKSILVLLFILAIDSIFANAQQEFSVLYKGRYRPVEAYAGLWLYDFYHASTLKHEDFSKFHTSSSSALDLLWALDLLGSTNYQQAPLFWIQSSELKILMGLNPTRNRFSYQELQQNFPQQNRQIFEQEKTKEIQEKNLTEEWSHLLSLFKQFEQLIGERVSLLEEAFLKQTSELQSKGIPTKEIERILEQEYPLNQRLKNAGILFHSLPSRYKKGDWLPLKALKVQVYQPSTKALKEVSNFTLFSDEDFRSIRQAYFTLEQAYKENDVFKIQENKKWVSEALHHAYQSLAGQVVQEAYGKALVYPTLTQLKIETVYVTYPWIALLILLYAIGSFLLLLSYHQQSIWARLWATRIIGIAIFFHTLLLVMRCYILGRPPVTNMFETILYVPWVAACTSLFFPVLRKNSLALLAASLTSIGLLVILEVTDFNQNLDQVQAVLDSQFWLLIHVLLVVGSYGVFILGAVLGHFYLVLFMAYRKENATMRSLSQMILQTMYGGTILLITGTILGGVWAAESWGRFWDWDPKESWAFISSCFYLIWIHAYRFQRIGSFGLAIGAVSGLLAISFTWYGVNYILGTGLHSYGFGSGGNLYYYMFIGTETLFLSIALWFYDSTSFTSHSHKIM